MRTVNNQVIDIEMHPYRFGNKREREKQRRDAMYVSIRNTSDSDASVHVCVSLTSHHKITLRIPSPVFLAYNLLD